MKKFNLKFLLGAGLLFFFTSISAQDFVHPGLLVSNESISRIQQQLKLKQHPTYDDFLLFKNNPESQANYKMKGPLAMVGRNPTIGQGIYDADANAAFQNALMWVLTNKREYADKAIEIVNAWSKTLKSITGKDAVLMAGLGPFKMVNAAELLRYSNAGWKQNDIAITEMHFEQVIYPVLKDFAPFANGNWDGAAEKTMMAIGIFCNNQRIYNRAVCYYEDGLGDGSILHYIYSDGQCQESGRDQQHTQLGLAHLADCCEMAWNQGLDLYGFANNRLLKGFEYTAKYNLGDSVNYTATLDRTGKYFHPFISEKGRGNFRAVYAEVYNHYHILKKMSTPYTGLASKKIEPEGQGLPGADHIGFGNLLYTRFENDRNENESLSKLAKPMGVIAKGYNNEVNLLWVKVRGAQNYSIERSDKTTGGFVSIANNIRQASFVDRNVSKGKLYYYRINAINPKVQSEFSTPVIASAGLPEGWSNSALNQNDLFSNTYFDGSTMIINTYGNGLMHKVFHGRFIHKAIKGNSTITIKYVPQLSSQFTSFGLMYKALRNAGQSVMLILQPVSTNDIEQPNWQIRFINSNADQVQDSVILNGDSDVVTYGRLTGSVWIKLEKKENDFIGFYSKDGVTWIKIGVTKNNLRGETEAGIISGSGKNEVQTTIKLENISIAKN